MDTLTHIAILEFDDQDGLVEYLNHPAHGPLAARFAASVVAACFYDFALSDGDSWLEALVRG